MGRKRGSDRRKKVDPVTGMRIAFNNSVAELGRLGAIMNLKNSASSKLLMQVLPKIMQDDEVRRIVSGVAKPLSPGQIYQSFRLIYDDLWTELNWNVVVCSLFAGQIDSFLSVRSLFERTFLLGDYSDATRLLDEVQEKFGYSLWLIEQRLLVLSRLSRDQSLQKNFRDKIIENDDVSHVVRFCTFFFSARSEDQISPSDFFATLGESLFDDNGIPVGATSHFLSLIFDYWRLPSQANDDAKLNVTTSMLFEVLLVTARLPIIDRYLALQKILTILFVRHKPNELSAVKNSLEILGKIQNAPVIGNVEFLLTGTARHTRPLEAEFSRLLTEYYESDSKNFGVDFYEKIRTFSIIPDSWILFLEWCGLNDIGAIDSAIPTGLLKDFLATLLSILHGSEGSISMVAGLRKALLQCSSHSWAPYAELVLDEILHFGTRNRSESRTYAGLNNSTRTAVARCLLQTKSEVTHSREVVGVVDQDSFILSLGSGFRTDDPRLLRAHCLSEIAERNAIATQGYIEELQRQSANYWTVAALRLELMARLRFSDYVGYIAAVAAVLLERPRLDYLLFIDEFSDIAFSLPYHIQKSLSASIDFPIVLDLLTKRGVETPRTKEAILEALEDFLSFCNVSLASEVTRLESQFDNAKLAYFLRSVCTLDNLQLLIRYPTSFDAEKDRLAICEYLIGRNFPGKETLDEEVGAIVKKRFIDDATRTIDDSKIYVDTSGVKSVARKRIGDRFNRLKALSNIDQAKEITRQLIERLNSMQPSDGLVVISIPPDEKRSVCRSILEDVFETFLFDGNFGLDFYLSTRVRHGTVGGQLRSVFERCGLITTLDAKRKRYPLSSELKGAFGERQDVADIIDRFDNAIDSIIARVKVEALHVKSSKKPNGWFDYNLVDSEIDEQLQILNQVSDLDEFLEQALTLLWRKTEGQLEKIRGVRFPEIREEFISSINAIETELSVLDVKVPAHIRTLVTRARTEISDEMDIISNWFRKSSERGFSDFLVRDVIDLCLRTAGQMNGFSFEHATLEIEFGRTISGRNLAPVYDIFYIILDNVAKHSKKSGEGVTLSIREDAGMVRCALQNPVLLVKKEKIDEIRSRIRSQEYLETARTEGGSGILKVHKILTVDLGSGCLDSFGYEDEESFHITWSLPIETLVDLPVKELSE